VAVEDSICVAAQNNWLECEFKKPRKDINLSQTVTTEHTVTAD